MAIKITGPIGGGGGGATTLNGLGDVSITSVANGQILKYNSVSGVWENTGLNITGGLTYKGTFNATTGTPSLANAEQGDFYLIDTAGTYEGIVWGIGDHLLINADMGGSVTASKIDKIDNTDAVTSVQGQTGAVSIYADDATLNLAGAGLTISGAAATSTLTVDTASTTAAGRVELATDAEAAAASATDRALTASNIGSIDTADLNNDAGFISGITNESLNDLNDVAYTAGAGIDNYVLTYDYSSTSWGAEAAPTAAAASTTVAGVVELATDAEAAAASANDKALTASNIGSIDTSDLNNDAGFISGITNESLNDLNDVAYTAGAGIDNYVLTYDHSSTSWGAEAVPTAAAASTTVAGVVELATDAEAAAASATDRALTASNIGSIDTADLNNDAGFISGITNESLNDLNDVAYTAGAGIDNYVLTYDHSSTSWGAEAAPTAAAASTTVAGVVELATDAEAAAASATDKALTASNIGSIDTSDLNNDAGFISGITNESLNNLSDVSYSAGAGIDNYVLTYDHGSTSWGAEAAPTAAAASTTVAGVVELATDAEAAAASATDKALTASNIGSIDTSDLNNDANFISDLLSDSSPQLGGNLDIQARIIETSTSNGSIELEPDGTGSVVARGTGSGNTPGTLTLNCEVNSHGVSLQSPAHADYSGSYALKLPTGVGTSNQALVTDGNNPAQLSWATVGGGGASRPTVTTLSSATNSTISDPSASVLEEIYLIDNSSTAVTITLPTVTGNAGYKLQIKRLGTADVTISRAGTATIDDGSATSTVLGVQYMSLTLCTDGTDWYLI